MFRVISPPVSRCCDGAYIFSYSYWPAFLTLLTLLLLGNKSYKWIYILYKTLPRDFRAAYRFFKLNRRMSTWIRRKETVPSIFGQLVRKHPHKVLFYYEEESWTFEELDQFSNQVAHYFKAQGYKKGDSIALLLENRPEYVALWLGLSKIGVITALINTNLLSDPLIHSLKVSHAKALIYGKDFEEAVSVISQDLRKFRVGGPESESVLEEIRRESSGEVAEVRDLLPSDKIMYIYTSGTTGLPKAAVITHTRYIYAAVGVYSLANFSPKDTLYNPLPFYHTAGGMLAIGQGLIFGMSVALRKKFSASNYWTDCLKYNCSVSVYIGEICRYLLMAHKPGTKVDHPVKKMLGNGLRPQIWQEFIETFHIDHVHEFYGSTEGNSNLMNIDNTVGSVGFVPRYASLVYPVILIRCEENSGTPLRLENGFCLRCKTNEPGLLIGKVNKNQVHRDFARYADEKATETKLLRNVFKAGDLYFNSGDMLVQDDFGNYYFKDRTGDTFRWKGENVATSEVEAVISNVAGLKDAVVYGVQIPGTEGRAGMAAIVDPDSSLELIKLAQGLKSRLPGYAIPIFLRIMDSLSITGTFKLKKMDLQKEGIDFNAIQDNRLYFYSPKLAQYKPLTLETYQDIVNGKEKV